MATQGMYESGSLTQPGPAAAPTLPHRSPHPEGRTRNGQSPAALERNGRTYGMVAIRARGRQTQKNEATANLITHEPTCRSTTTLPIPIHRLQYTEEWNRAGSSKTSKTTLAMGVKSATAHYAPHTFVCGDDASSVFISSTCLPKPLKHITPTGQFNSPAF